MSDDDSFEILGSSPSHFLLSFQQNVLNSPITKELLDEKLQKDGESQENEKSFLDLSDLRTAACAAEGDLSDSSEELMKNSKMSLQMQVDNDTNATNGTLANLFNDERMISEKFESVARSLTNSELDALKDKVHSQFPSLSSSPEDLVKLEIFINDHVKLKNTLKTCNEEIKKNVVVLQSLKDNYDARVKELEKTILQLNNENMELKKGLETKNEKLLQRNKKTIEMLSEKVENMRVQFQKKKSKENSIEHSLDIEMKANSENFDKDTSLTTEKDSKLEDMKNNYIGNINDLKRKLSITEESLKAAQLEINTLKFDHVASFTKYEKDRNEMKLEMELLQNQVKDYSKNSQIQKVREIQTDKILMDVCKLQEQNVKLFENITKSQEESKKKEHDGIERKETLNLNKVETGTIPKTLPMSRRKKDEIYKYPCPMCDLFFDCMDVLQVHVQDCIDENY